MKKMVIDLQRRRTPHHTPVKIQGLDIELVDRFKYLGVHLNNRLDWLDNTDALYKKGQSPWTRTRVNKTLLSTFYDTVVASAILYAIVCWVGGSTEQDRKRLNKLVRRVSSVLGCPLDLVEEVARGIGGSVVGFSPIMRQARVRFPAAGCSAGSKPGKMGGLRQEGHLA
ncbi:hypothetical protein QTP70_009563 [Hemibagrus guttatus]|uniref:Alkylated DNA repair protein AlkB homologue 8 N-terminal domain-containing protein n=1 Tax=Hemibagrus guttatus TaxID=175788 RepID=A0AAE0R6S5_9TELE|nr:hypothetical protein QTP70_009563 [Hemibagrus guttatus]